MQLISLGQWSLINKKSTRLSHAFLIWTGAGLIVYIRVGPEHFSRCTSES